MKQQFKFPTKEERKILHAQILADYDAAVESKKYKTVKSILDELANKYGYSGGGQVIRNIINVKKKETEAV